MKAQAVILPLLKPLDNFGPATVCFWIVMPCSLAHFVHAAPPARTDILLMLLQGRHVMLSLPSGLLAKVSAYLTSSSGDNFTGTAGFCLVFACSLRAVLLLVTGSELFSTSGICSSDWACRNLNQNLSGPHG